VKRRSPATPNELKERMVLLEKGFKFCTKCEVTKPTGDFYKNCGTYDGYSTACKDCKEEYRRKYTREGRYKERRNRYARENREIILSQEHRYKESNRDKRRAKNKLNAAIRFKGFPHISTRRCSVCGGTATHYHHWSYEEEHWLDVIPLCDGHHADVHNGALTIDLGGDVK